MSDTRLGLCVNGPIQDVSSTSCSRWYNHATADVMGPLGGAVPGSEQVVLLRPGHGDLNLLAGSVNAHRGMTWLLGNEPNNGGQDNIEPEHFADWFAQASQIIKSTDGSARIGAPGVLNWARYGGNMTGVEWSTRFLARYRAIYGQPPIDIWTLHTYGMDGTPSEDATGDAVDIQRCATDIAGSGLGGPPIWITEFGAVRMGGDFGAMVAYLDAIVPWLRVGGASYGVQAWFLFASRATDGASYAIEANGDLNDCGRRYREYALGLR